MLIMTIPIIHKWNEILIANIWEEGHAYARTCSHSHIFLSAGSEEVSLFREVGSCAHNH